MEKGQDKRTDTLQTENVFTRKEYIEREAAYNTLTGYYHHSTDIQHEALREALGRVPAADVMPVVRCRDCKHRDPEDRKCDCGGFEHAHMFPVSDDWFCADGEKRDVEHD